jgi:hypothetical protein
MAHKHEPQWKITQSIRENSGWIEDKWTFWDWFWVIMLVLAAIIAATMLYLAFRPI